MWTGLDWSDIGKFAAWVLGTAGASFGGSYFGTYLKKKGENLATHEDIDKVVDQVKAVTQTTKEIESKISGDLWNKQKHWEMKRDAIFDMSRKISGVDDALSTVYSSNAHFQALAERADALSKAEALAKVSGSWSVAADGFDGALGLMTIVCNIETCQALREFIIFTRRLVPEIQKNAASYLGASKEMAQKLRRIQDLLRKELGVEGVAASNSSGPAGKS